MNTLTIPQLSLFHQRRTPVHQPDHQYLRYDHGSHSRYNYLGKTAATSAARDFYPPPTRGVSSSSRYKQIAEDYLEKKNKSPSYFIDSTPYILNIPSYLPKPQQKKLGSSKCQCEYGFQSKKQTNAGLESAWPQNRIHQKETKLLKDPYLAPTFRETKGFLSNMPQTTSIVPPTREQQNFERNVSRNQIRQESYVSRKQVNEAISNSKIMEKLKTHQSDEVQQHPKSPNVVKKAQLHQASIQTQKLANQSNLASQRQNSKSRPQVQRILQEQKMLIESLKFEVQKQGDFRNQVEDLESTKEDYIEKSRELLLKLNQLADDKREFGFVLKAFTKQKTNNVFRNLDL